MAEEEEGEKGPLFKQFALLPLYDRMYVKVQLLRKERIVKETHLFISAQMSLCLV